MRKTRVIVTLLLDEGGLYKSTKFGDLKYIGDPINAIKIFNDKCVDELCVLDIRATKNNREPDWEVLSSMAIQAFFPLSYGGGIRTVQEVRKLFSIGFEKVVFTSALFDDPELVINVVGEFGSQAVTAFVNCKKSVFGNYKIYDYRSKSYQDPSISEFLKFLVKLNVGEIILNSVDKDGTLSGFDLRLVDHIPNDLNIPIVMLGGAKSINDFALASQSKYISGVAAGAFFVFYGKLNAVLINYPSLVEMEENIE